MTYLPQLLTLAGVMLLACISPGPDVLAVTSYALASRRGGVWVALGVSLGCTLWATLAVFGLGVVILRLGPLYQAIRLCGAAYLVYLGLHLLVSARRAGPAPQIAAAAAGGRGLFRRGLMVNLTNPKAVVFFGSLFVTILPVDAPGWVHAAVVAVVGGVACFWFVALALMLSAGRVRALYLAARRPVDALMGAALVALGARLAIEA